MIRLLASAFLYLLANTVGLLVTSALFDGFSIDTWSFVSVVLLFTFVEVIAGPLIAKIAFSSAPVLMGGTALVTTFVGLVITDTLSDGLSISGLDTWIFATVTVWLFTLIASLLLPLFIFKKALGKAKESSAKPAEKTDTPQ